MKFTSIKFTSVITALLLSTSAYGFGEDVANPAATCCSDNGGSYTIVNGDDGQSGTCTVDGVTTEGQKFYRENCVDPGSDRDSNGCIPSAGESYCESLDKCIRSWETDCPSPTDSPTPPPPTDSPTPPPRTDSPTPVPPTDSPTSSPIDPGSDRDEHGCIPSAGESWCPSLNECIRSWETDCPSPGSDRDKHGCIPSAGESWCPSLNECIRSWETDCPNPTPSPTRPAPGSDRDEHGCIPSAGESWCPSLNECIRSWETDCPSPGSDRDKHGCIPSAGESWCPSLNKCIRSWETDCPDPTPSPTRKPTRRPTRSPTRNPTRRPTRSPTRNPTRRPTNSPTRNPTARSMPGSDRDEHGCIPSAGYVWCEPLEQCIRPWETSCAKVITSPAPTASPTARPSLRPVASPTMPGSDRDEHGCIPSAGYVWCEPLKECIRPWETTCVGPLSVPTATPSEAPSAPSSGGFSSGTGATMAVTIVVATATLGQFL